MIYYQNNDYIFRTMKKEDIEDFFQAFEKQGWDKPKHIFENYFNEQFLELREVVVAQKGNIPIGYATLLPNAKNGPFANKNIPEICDFNVLKSFQKNGVGSKILDICESLAKNKSNFVSLGVGLYTDYGAAQRLYVKRGFVPDGSGVWYNDLLLLPYETCVNDDNLVLYMIKEI